MLVSRFLDPHADALRRAPQVPQQAALASTAEELTNARQHVDALRARPRQPPPSAAAYGLTD